MEFTGLSQVVLVVKNPPAKAGDTRDVVRKMVIHFSSLAWKVSWTRGAWWAIVPGVGL